MGRSAGAVRLCANRALSRHIEQAATCKHCDEGDSSMLGHAGDRWMRSTSVAVAMAAGCGPEVGPPVGGSGSGSDSAGSSSTTEGAATLPGQSTGELPDSTTSPDPSSGSEGVDSTGSTGELAECPPREIPQAGNDPVWFRALIGERTIYPAPEQADCVLDEIVAMPARTDFVLSCSFPDGTNDVMTVRFELALDLEGAALSPGMPLTWTRSTAVCCGDFDQHSIGLRDPEGELMLAFFQGWDPVAPAGVTVLDPVALAIVPEVCPPCEGSGCRTRMAVDVSVGEPMARIYDGAIQVLGDDPAFRIHVLEAAETGVIFEGPPHAAEVLAIRLVP
jgi:hypothetical protein